ncbi:hypothetical protein G6W61_10225 [Streptomyces sp. KAI-26]|uniref:hypothetical protein n=1 Tax=Streptomyces sp. KAI-26 TaxID=1169747 RepID=UPI0015875416|nr:hypothetical protein [Streptomyces sp. KAI-26]NUV86583.1 hypothetical protein [Streptomyces sp. KAI-26]NUW21222.1 hypothetical protein [Streptomyces roseoviolaceus]
MDLTITVRGCDQCKRKDRPATRYTLTVEDGQKVTRDLCAEDAAPLEAVFGPLPKAEEMSPEDAIKEQILTLLEEGEREASARRARREQEHREQNSASAKRPPAKKAPAKQTTAKKTPAKQTTARPPGTKSLTVAEIEALKAEGKQ